MLLSFIIFLSSCGSNMSGIIIEVGESGTFYFAEGMKPEEYAKIDGKEVNDLTEKGLSLYALNYTGNHIFEAGDHVGVWIDGDVFDSYPAQANAKKIKEIE